MTHDAFLLEVADALAAIEDMTEDEKDAVFSELCEALGIGNSEEDNAP